MIDGFSIFQSNLENMNAFQTFPGNLLEIMNLNIEDSNFSSNIFGSFDF